MKGGVKKMGIMNKKKNKNEEAKPPVDNDVVSDEELAKQPDGQDTPEQDNKEQEDSENKGEEKGEEVTVNDVLKSHEERLKILELKTGLRTY